MKSLNNAEIAAFENMRWLDRLAWFALISTVGIVVSKFIGEQTFGWTGIDLPMKFISLFFTSITIIHFYITVLVIRSFRHIWKLSEQKDRIDFFERLIATGSFLTRGILVRESSFSGEAGSHKKDFIDIDYYLNTGDPPVWVITVFMALVVIAITPFEISFNAIILYFVSATIVIINWNIGSHWMIALSDLSLSKDRSIYFGRANSKGIRMIMSMSGITSFGSNRSSVWLIPGIIFITLLYSLLAIIFIIPMFGAAILWIVWPRYRRHLSGKEPFK